MLNAFMPRLYDTKPEALRAASDLLLGGAPVVVGLVNNDERFIFANEAYRDWIGRPPAEIVGLTVRDVLGEEVYARIHGYIRRVLAGETVSFERYVERVSGRRFVQSHYVPCVDAAGAQIGYRFMAFDITDRRDAEERLARSESQFSGAFRHSAIGMALVGPDGRWIDVNPAICALLGYDAAELKRTTFQALTYPDDLESDLQLLGELVGGARDAYHMEKRYIHKSGALVYAILSVSLVRDEAGAPAYFVSQVQDITARKQAEEQLFRERELAEVTLSSIGDAVITTNVEGLVTSINAMAEGIVGLSAAAGVGQPLESVFRVFSQETGAPVPNPLSEAIRLGRRIELAADSMLRRPDGRDVDIEDSAAPIRSRAGAVIGGVLVFRDVSEQRALAGRLAYLAHHDQLTGLPNRVLFNDRLERALSQAARHGDIVAVLFLDLDRFKFVNDSAGHAAGDLLLKAVSARLSGCLRDSDTVGRWGGDEFAVILSRLTDPAEAETTARRIIDSLSAPFSLPGAPEPFEIGVSIGVAVYPDDGRDGAALIKSADAALYEAKDGGRNTFRLHRPLMIDRAQRRHDAEATLRHALRTSGLALFYQRKVDLATQETVGFEALIRVRTGKGLELPPSLIPVAEATGLIHQVGAWTLDAACRQIAAWTAAGAAVPVAVNVSPVQFRHPGFFDVVADALRRHALDPQLLELELTEHLMVDHEASSIARMERLRDLGVRLTIDDFGVGYSNLSYLQRFPIDCIKIDRMFVAQVDQGPDDRAIVEAIVGLGLKLGKHIVAEGIETAGQRDALVAMRCPVGQGYLFGRPGPAPQQPFDPAA